MTEAEEFEENIEKLRLMAEEHPCLKELYQDVRVSSYADGGRGWQDMDWDIIFPMANIIITNEKIL